MPDGSYRILDEDEYEKHGELMGYDEQLDQVIHKEMNDLIELIEQRMSPFDEEEIKRLYHKYQKLLKE